MQVIEDQLSSIPHSSNGETLLERVYTPKYMKRICKTSRLPYSKQEVTVMRLNQNQRLVFGGMLNGKDTSSKQQMSYYRELIEQSRKNKLYKLVGKKEQVRKQLNVEDHENLRKHVSNKVFKLQSVKRSQRFDYQNTTRKLRKKLKHQQKKR